jgi:hypothetical protein
MSHEPQAPACGFDERLAAFVSGEPDDELAAHLPGCATCRAEVEAVRQVLRALGGLSTPARSPARPEGELFFADFGRGVRALHDAEVKGEARRRRRRFVVSGGAALMLAAAAALVFTLTRAGKGRSGAGPGGDGGEVAAVDTGDVQPDDLAPDDRPEETVEALDDEHLDAVLAQLGGAAVTTSDDDLLDEARDPDPLDTVEALDDDALDAVFDALSQKGA